MRRATTRAARGESATFPGYRSECGAIADSSTRAASCAASCACGEARDGGRDRVGRELAGVRRDDVAVGVDEDERGPRAHGVRAPDAALPVVDDGVRDAESE